MSSEDDLAAIAATVLFDNTYAGSILDASGPPVSARDRVRLIGGAIGEPLRLDELTADQTRQRWRSQG